MESKTATAQQRYTRPLLPFMLNKRRYSLKKILNRYMGLPFSQHQPAMSIADIREAGLGEAFSAVQHTLMHETINRDLIMETLAIEVRGIAVAFDEEVSFSGYRYLTLQSPVYSLPLLPCLHRYQEYCKQHAPQRQGDLLPTVEQALRERSLQEFMQDLLPAVHHIPLIRLSVFDQFKLGNECNSLGYILEADLEHFYLPVADYICREMERVDELFLPCF